MGGSKTCIPDLVVPLEQRDIAHRAAALALERVEASHPVARVALEAYVGELRQRFPRGFDPGPIRDEPGAHHLLAASDGEPVAFGGIRPLELGRGEAVAEVKRMWVSPAWRGAGLGARMLRELEALARAEGSVWVVLDTQSTLVEAIALYERSGYRRIDRYNDNPYAELFFEKRLA